MISIKNITKKFGKNVAVNNISLNIPNGSICGLVGSNGSGKSTILRTIAGIIEPDCGEVQINDENIFENPKLKSEIFFVPDFPFFFNKSDIKCMAKFYKSIYSTWSDDVFNRLCSIFPIDSTKIIADMSKGMQRQAEIILALSTRPKYLLLDEVFDGLDPIMRKQLKSLLIESTFDDNTSIVIATHNLKELEDLCDYLILLHNGDILIQSNIEQLKSSVHKIQIVYEDEPNKEFFNGLDIIKINKQGSLLNLTIRGEEKRVFEELTKIKPIFIESIEITLEEIFINEVEASGYEIKKIM